jgi:hypothetical protein
MNKRKKTNFEKLQDKWYKKLEKTGFKDIEYADMSVKSARVSRSLNWSDPTLRQSVLEYYLMAYNFLIDYKFESEVDKIIWEYYAEGLSIRDIVQILKDTKVMRTNKVRVWKTVKQLEIAMKKMYLSV